MDAFKNEERFISYMTTENIKSDNDMFHSDLNNRESPFKKENKPWNNNNQISNKPKTSLEEIRLNIDILTYNDLILDFDNFEKLKHVSKTKQESEYIFFRKLMNAFALFLENKTLLDKLYIVIQNKNIKEKILSFNFYKNGKLTKSKVQLNKTKYFFEHLYEAYTRFLSRKAYNKNFIKDPLFTESDMIQELTGLYAIEKSLEDFPEKIELINKINDNIYKENNLVFLSNEENDDEIYQSFYQIIGVFEINDIYNEKINLLNSDKSNNFFLSNQNIFEGLNSDNKNYFNIRPSAEDKLNNMINSNKNVIFKIRLINQNSLLKNDLRSQVLLDKNESELHKLLYQDKDDSCFTWLKIEELYGLFTNIHIFSQKPFQMQMNCKFLKTINKDNHIEFKSKWKYSFNTNINTKEIVIGIHQNQFLYSSFSRTIFIGFVILQSSGGNYSYVDHVYLNETYNNYLHLKLEIGTYMIIPITAGFGPTDYLYNNDNKEEDRVPIENEIYDLKNLQLIKTKDKEGKKYLSDCANYLCEEIFNKFDMNRDEILSIEESAMLFKSANMNILDEYEGSDFKEKTINLIKASCESSENILTFKKYKEIILYLSLKKGEEFLREFFTKYGYENFENANSRSAYLSFHCNNKLDIAITDNLLTNFNRIVYQMIIKRHGMIAQEEGKLLTSRNTDIFELKQYSSKDGRVLSFAVENKFDKKKNFEINITSQILFTFTHNRISCILERGESKFLMTLLAKKIINKYDDNKVLIKLGPTDKSSLL